MTEESVDQERPDEGRSSLRRLLLVASAAVLVVLVLAGYEASRDLARLKARETQLEGRLERTQEQIGLLEDRAEGLKADPLALERVAREELGLVRPNEVVIILPPENTDPKN